MRAEFNQDLAVKNRNEILYEMDFNSTDNKHCGTIAGDLLVPDIKMSSGSSNVKDPLMKGLAKNYKKHFSSFIFVHDALDPSEIYFALKNYLQPSASFAIFC